MPDRGLTALTVRPARPADTAPLGLIDRATWSPAVSPGRRPDGDFHWSPGTTVLTAVIDGSVAGYVQLRAPTPLQANVHVRLISGLAVDPGRQGRGVARALLEAAADHARDEGAQRLRLHVLSRNTAARTLYARCGYVEEGVLRGEFVLDGELVDDVLMARSL